MALFNAGNPALSEKTFKSITFTGSADSAMTLNGTLNKLGFLTLMLVVGAAFSWKAFYDNASYAHPLLYIGLFGALATGFAMAFKKEWAPFLAPAYAVLEGLLLGSVSAMYDYLFAEKMPNIIFNAVGLTLGTVVAMLLLYRFRIIKPTQRFKSIVLTGLSAIGIFYLVVIVVGLFGIQLPFMYDSSPLGIGISLVILGFAAMSLILTFEMIEKGAEQGAPKYMEWYSAFGLMVTIVWLYLEILRLLSRFAGSRN